MTDPELRKGLEEELAKELAALPFLEEHCREAESDYTGCVRFVRAANHLLSEHPAFQPTEEPAR
jgi:hypothetical protein